MTMAVLVTILVAMTAEAAEGEIFCNAGVLEQSWALLKAARYGLGRQEEAAFVVRGDGGALSFVLWRSTGEAMASHFSGAMPAHVVAIVHTHPMNQLMPSADDSATARRLGIPVYVLERGGITRTFGDHNEKLVLGDWNPEGQRPSFSCN